MNKQKPQNVDKIDNQKGYDEIEAADNSIEQCIIFDLDGNGMKPSTEWIDGNDVLFVYNSNSIITDCSELFGCDTELSDGDGLGWENTDGC